MLNHEFTSSIQIGDTLQPADWLLGFTTWEQRGEIEQAILEELE